MRLDFWPLFLIVHEKGVIIGKSPNSNSRSVCRGSRSPASLIKQGSGWGSRYPIHFAMKDADPSTTLRSGMNVHPAFAAGSFSDVTRCGELGCAL